jgi:hypothetical protein
MLHITDANFNVDAIMDLFQGIETNIPLAGTWNRPPLAGLAS